MTIETKYFVGQEVWFMAKKEIMKKEYISSIRIDLYEKTILITYSFAFDPLVSYLERDVFKSKADLLNSL